MTFKSRILTDAVINSKHIESRQFFEDAREIMLVCGTLWKNMIIDKINTVFNDDFVTYDKSANKSITTKHYEILKL